MNGTSPMVTLEGASLRVSGEVDAVSVVALRKQGEKLIDGAEGSLAVDLSGLATAHSVVLSILMCSRRLAASTELALSFAGASDRLVSLAALSKLEARLPGCPAHS